MKTLAQVQEIVDRIKMLDRKFVLMRKGDGFLLQVQYHEADVDTGHPALQKARKHYVSPHMTETEIVDTAFYACLRSAEHIVREHFTYRGRRVQSPHFTVEARIAVCDLRPFDRRPSP